MTAPFVEHRSTERQVTVLERGQFGVWERVTKTLYVCSCGHRTRAFRKIESARRERDLHAVAGQLSFGD